jgi:hypothetical protein
LSSIVAIRICTSLTLEHIHAHSCIAGSGPLLLSTLLGILGLANSAARPDWIGCFLGATTNNDDRAEYNRWLLFFGYGGMVGTVFQGLLLQYGAFSVSPSTAEFLGHASFFLWGAVALLMDPYGLKGPRLWFVFLVAGGFHISLTLHAAGQYENSPPE